MINKIQGKNLLNVLTILTILSIMFFVSINSLSASEVVINNTTSEGIKESINNGNNTINLTNGTYTGINNTDITINYGKNITIQSQDPNNKAIIDCEGIRFLTNNGNLTLINIIIKNAQGGALGNNPSAYLNIINCTFINNTDFIGDYGGGAITNFGNCSILGSTFVNNSAGTGGAIYNYANDLNVTQSNFINNHASSAWGGGAIYSTSNIVILNSSNFTNNTSNGYGGAIMIYYGVKFIVENCEFKNNNGTYGGAISNFVASNLTIRNSNFTNNNASNHGGAIYTNPASLYTYIFTSNFNNNFAGTYGGAIFNGKYMYLSGNLMIGNFADILGNAILNFGEMGILNLTYLNNQTIIVNNNTGNSITIFATLTDDMGNPVSYGNISFYVNGILIGIIESVEGYANITYYFNHTNGLIPVTGDYTGNGMFDININNGALLFVSETTVNGDINLDKKEYWVNETVKAKVNVKNNGPNVAKNVKVKINLNPKFILNKDSVIVSHGYYDSNTNIWHVGDLNIDEEAKMTFNGKFTEKGNYIFSILVYGDNFNDSTSIANALVKENSTPKPTPEPENNTNNTIKNPVTTAAMKETGIPIIAAILVLLVSLGLIYRKQ